MRQRVGAGSSIAIAALFVSLGIFYLVSRLAANALGVITVDLEASLDLHATQTAALAGGLSLAYGLAQVPGSMMIGRLGPRVVAPVAGIALGVAALGSAAAPGFWSLLASRVMIGVFLAPIFPASLAIEIERVGESRFATLSGALTWLGRLGVVGATAPLAALIAVAGWRGALGWLAAISVFAALAVGVVLVLERKDRQGWAPRASMRLMNVLSLLKTPGFAASVVFQGAGSAVVSGILGFWGSGWLKNVYGMSLAERSFELLVLALSWAASALIWGEAPRLFGRSAAPLLAGAALIAVCLAIPALLTLDRRWLAPWFAVLGLAAGYYPALLSNAKTLLPDAAVVHGIALVSTGSMVCVFVGQVAAGFILDAFPGKPGVHPPEAYAAIFAVCAIAMIGSALGLWRSSRLTREVQPA